MREHAARWIVLASLAGIVAVVILLASGLGQVRFSDGYRFDEHIDRTISSSTSGSGDSGKPRPVPLWALGIPVALGVAAVVIFGRGGRQDGPGPEARGRQVNGLLWTLIALFAITWFIMLARNFAAPDPEEAAELTPSTVDVVVEGNGTPLESASTAPVAGEKEAPPEDAQATSTILAAFVGIVAVAAVVGLVFVLRARRTPPPEEAPITTDLLAPVRDALENLRRGRDAAGVVEECYRDMVGLLSEVTKIDPRTLTPREFARSVAAAGLGADALAELTDLFELVRYGRRPDDAFAATAARCIAELRHGLAQAAAEGAR